MVKEPSVKRCSCVKIKIKVNYIAYCLQILLRSVETSESPIHHSAISCSLHILVDIFPIYHGVG